MNIDENILNGVSPDSNDNSTSPIEVTPNAEPEKTSEAIDFIPKETITEAHPSQENGSTVQTPLQENENETDLPVKEQVPVFAQESVTPYSEERKVYSSYHINQTIPTPQIAVENKHQTKKGEKSGGRFIFKAIASGLIFGLVAFGTLSVLSHFYPLKTKNIGEVTSTDTPKDKLLHTNSTVTVSSSGTDLTTVSSVTQEVMPAVVSINCTSTIVYNSFFGQQQYQSNSAGTGIIVGSNDTELLIATNNHVIANVESIQIAFCDDSIVDAYLKGSAKDIDLAVVAVKWDDLNEETKSAIKIATLGDSDELIVGEPAIAIGNSLGYGQSVTSGIISALEREVTVTTDDSYGYGNYQEITSYLIQTDAAINPGNSGGPLLNSKGEVIGINSVKYSSEEVEGMGYAIPINDALPILEDLMSRATKEKVAEDEQSYIGITGTDVTSDVTAVYGIPEGVFVAQVMEDTPADKYGLKRGDIICELNDITITSMDDLTEELLYYKAGTTIELVIYRNHDGEYEEMTIELKLGAKKDAPSSIEEIEEN